MVLLIVMVADICDAIIFCFWTKLSMVVRVFWILSKKLDTPSILLVLDAYTCWVRVPVYD